MTRIHRASRAGAASMLLFFAAACSSTGGLGGILGNVLGGGGGEVAGSIQGINTRTQQIDIGRQMARAWCSPTTTIRRSSFRDRTIL